MTEGVRFAEWRCSVSGGGHFEGLRATPADDAARSGAGIVLLHGAHGLDEAAKGGARRLAAAGFAVVAPSLLALRSEAGAEPGGAARELSDREVQAALEAALEHLCAEEGADQGRLGVLGLGQGGTLAFLAACRSRRLAAAVLFHAPIVRPALSAAQPVQPLDLALNLSAPLLYLYGADDPELPPEEVERLRSALSQFARPFDIVSFPGAGAGLCDPAHPGSRPAAAGEAWERALAFLEEQLGGSTADERDPGDRENPWPIKD